MALGRGGSDKGAIKYANANATTTSASGSGILSQSGMSYFLHANCSYLKFCNTFAIMTADGTFMSDNPIVCSGSAPETRGVTTFDRDSIVLMKNGRYILQALRVRSLPDSTHDSPRDSKSRHARSALSLIHI